MTANSEERLSLLGDGQPEFPPTHLALREPNGLLAVGGRLSPEWLLAAYRRGIFPWYSDGQPILWWSPTPRCVVLPDQYSIGRSLRKTLRRGRYSVTFDRCFSDVIDACSEPRADDEGTWITGEMRDAYVEMHRLGHAHSVETWEGDRLVGGLYGLAIGRVFFGESMFHRATDASKVAFAHLVRQLQSWDCPLIDCQVSNPHLASLGAVEIERTAFERLLARGTAMSGFPRPWTLSWNIEQDL
ncbi:MULTISPECIES: leucyl/phenylalanyl-tRNA--protein transferase [Microbulbifer]|uniref:leucyl/phenylalanyl-tRNA--protein transferase n=1 Tax=Microbulbifer TaxID=48073 RepID=UPI001E34F7FB|nr:MULTISPECIES: leucyl/phenylalanyl-tRNA--protein transferase [Microbulbifer]UHQ55662.1 leucyl/phenylalanyl-tRNA--protein transferase [Microbulbifer sp. YPW16]